jgi:TonB family protein
MELYRDSLTDRRRGFSRLASPATSIVAHAVVVLLIFALTLHTVHVRRVKPAARCCVTALYSLNSAGISSALRSAIKTDHSVEHVIRKKPLPPTPAPPVKASASPQPAGSPSPAQQSQTTLAGSGTGSEDAQPAYPVYSPSPRVGDRSLLPGASQSVVVDVDVSATGDVTDEKLVQGLGNPLDQLVLDTVRGWRFNPATVDGKAVASVSELVFPFNRNYPRTEG